MLELLVTLVSAQRGGDFIEGGGGLDFNPILLQGVRGYPEIRVRLNQRAFQYASGMIADVISQEIKRARIPPIVQCLPQLSGCVQIYNLYISRYRYPQQVVMYPAPPNRITLQVQNVDFGVTGNLGGQVVILLPIALTGIIQINIHQATITVQMSVERGPYGPYLRVLTCNVHIGYADAYVEYGGIMGDIANSLLRQRISKLIRRMIPGQICGQLPSVVNAKVNIRLASLPQAIAVSQMLSKLIGALVGGISEPTPNAEYCKTYCRGNVPIDQAKPVGPAVAHVLAPSPAVVYQRDMVAGPALAPQISRAHYNQRTIIARGLPQRFYETNQMFFLTAKVKRQFAQIYHITNGNAIPTGVANSVAGAPSPMFAPPSANLCASCPVNGGQGDRMSVIRQLLSNLDMRKLNDLYLSLQILNTQATFNGFIIDVVGESSPNAQRGTPFGPFPTMFPSYQSNRMAEFIVSDYTINSMLYWMHRNQFFAGRIGPETPKFGGLLRTTCDGDEDEEAARAHVHMGALNILKKRLRTKRVASFAGKGNRRKRQDLGDIGVCLGDILPGVKEKYPKQNIAIQLRTIRAPSVVFSAAQGGQVTLDALADAALDIDGTNNMLGTMTIATTVVLRPQLRGNRLTGSAQITNFKITDRTGSLKLEQDALDNLANLIKGVLQEPLSDAIQKGISTNTLTRVLDGLPISLVNPEIRIIEHGLYIATDITIPPSLLGVDVGQC
ncbi:LBP / BPI / CETP family protein [Ancylostoma ceylanicum]|uniref:LBP / BPI / CETP family protein n=1 Tax=Ancylostoma ceylanicum TaxID=53326 RepID=A0A0D6LLI4_9BILA|nr:LBP / BPI / CETP family protein [Ancylostoma ceylanicum]